MTSLQRAIKTTAVAVAALIGVSVPVMASTVTISGSGFRSLVDSGGPGALVINADPVNGAFGPNPGGAYLSGPNVTNVNPNSPTNQFSDTANIFINSGTTINGTVMSFGTLNNVLAQGAAGNISFDVFGTAPGSSGTVPLPLRQIVLSDPNNPANRILIHGSAASGLGVDSPDFGSNTAITGTLASGNVFNSNTSTWSQLTGVLDDGTALGNWNVAALAIGVPGSQ